MTDRAHDIVVWGATGFTGKLVAEYIAKNAPAGLRWAIGGRDAAKLERVRRELPASASNVPIVVHDAGSREAMTALALSTRVVCTTVGPYAKYGYPLASACAKNGTDYCDLTGEPPFMAKVIRACHDDAKKSGARVVHACGFDSIPSDLGMLVLAEAAGRPLAEARLVVTASRGGVSGGTLASMFEMVDEVRRDPEARKVLTNAYALDPNRADAPRSRAKRPPPVRWDKELGSFVGPFPMDLPNGLVVRRSNALLGYRYGQDLDYSEGMIASRAGLGLPSALVMTAGMAGLMVGAAFGPTRRLLEARLPKPGEGPSEAERQRGFFKIQIAGRLEGERSPTVFAHVEGRSDPGYGETSKMLGESAMCLALDPRAPGFEGGVLTPATAMGMRLVARLRAAGMRFDAA